MNDHGRIRGVATRAPAFAAEAYGPAEWGLMAATGVMWGSSFLWIEVALHAFEPGAIALGRVLLGAATLAWFPAARRPIERADVGATVLLGLLWMALPFVLFPIAQQWIDSSLAGMINGGVPIFAALVAARVARRWPPMRTIVAIAIGFAGVVAISAPALQGSRSTALGVGLVLAATLSYGIAINIAAPLQRKYGALPVLLRAQLVAVAATSIPGLLGASGSSFGWPSLAAMVPLGVLGTGLAFVALTILVGRAGPGRASVTVYLVPLVAVGLGAAVRDETIAPLSLAGMAVVILGAVLAGRDQAPVRGGEARP